MSESAAAGAPLPDPPRDIDPGALIEALRARGAQRFDPAGLRFVEALARRAAAHRAEARCMLDRALDKAVTEFGERFDRAEREAREALARATARFPEAAEALRQHVDCGDFGALRQRLARLEAQGASGPLAQLLTHIGRHTLQTAPGGGAAHAGEGTTAPPAELKSLSYFRSTWSRLSVDRQLAHAFAQAPENAGPLNSHFLVIQSLKTMRELCPGYLEQFMSYADALLWLDQADARRSPAQKGAVRGERDKKRKPARRDAG